MAKHRWKNTEARIAKLMRQGRGAGAGADYVPWIKIHDFSSLGRVHRCVSAKSGREVHLLSDGESDLFLQLDASPLVADIREQFPLDRAATIGIAEELGYHHPSADGIDIVMTTDLLVTLRTGGSKAIAVKTELDLLRGRVREKLEIERVFWTQRATPWMLFVASEEDRERDRAVRLNHQEVAEWRAAEDLIDDRVEWDRRATAMIVEIARGRDARLLDVCRRAEAAYGWEPGVGIAACKRLMAMGLARLADDRRFDPRQSVRQVELLEEPVS